MCPDWGNTKQEPAAHLENRFLVWRALVCLKSLFVLLPTMQSCHVCRCIYLGVNRTRRTEQSAHISGFTNVLLHQRCRHCNIPSISAAQYQCNVIQRMTFQEAKSGGSSWWVIHIQLVPTRSIILKLISIRSWWDQSWKAIVSGLKMLELTNRREER